MVFLIDCNETIDELGNWCHERLVGAQHKYEAQQGGSHGGISTEGISVELLFFSFYFSTFISDFFFKFKHNYITLIITPTITDIFNFTCPILL